MKRPIYLQTVKISKRILFYLRNTEDKEKFSKSR